MGVFLTFDFSLCDQIPHPGWGMRVVGVSTDWCIIILNVAVLVCCVLIVEHSFQGAKLFNLSGLSHGCYPKTEIHNLGRFISVMKFRPLQWRASHPFVLVDRYVYMWEWMLVGEGVLGPGDPLLL